jgi:hypothetical protein
VVVTGTMVRKTVIGEVWRRKLAPGILHFREALAVVPDGLFNRWVGDAALGASLGSASSI